MKISAILFFSFFGMVVQGQTGIGTTTPAVKLHVKSNGPIFRLEGSDHAYMEFYPQGAGTRYGYLGFPNASSTQLTFMNQFTAGSIAFGTNGTSRMFLNSDGKLGLGTSNASTSLHIENGNTFGTDPSNTNTPSLYINNTNNASTTAHASAVIRTNGSGGGNPYLAFDITGVSGYSIGIDNADNDKLKFHTNWSLNGSATPVMTITNESRIGIGTTSPQVPLHVASSVAQYVNVYGYLNQNQAQGAYTANTNVSYSIQADQRIRAPEFNAISDARIKKDVLKLNTKKQLGELNQLKVVNYSYIDQLVNGAKSKTGFIAQEVEAVNPKFVNQSTDFIPSVFALAQSVSINEDLLQLTTEKPHGFEKGELVKLYAQGKKEFILRIEEVSNSQSFSVKGWSESLDNIFIYGKQVKDFRAIDFDQITALSVGAIQELSKQVEILKLENESLHKRISNEVQKQQSNIEKRLLQLELKLKKRRK